MGDSTFRLGAVGDLHCREGDAARMKELFRAMNAECDGVVLCGDLTDHGLGEEVRVLADALSTLTIPCAAVLGNHDCEAGAAKEICHALHDAGVYVLDGDHVVLAGEVGIAGTKGFGGGFGTAMLQPFGEGAIKTFVQEGVSETLKLEVALGQLDVEKRVVALHYSPVVDTTEGENPEIRPYLGTSRLAGPIDAYGATFVVHGHAHHGAHAGRTPRGVPVFNVATPVLRRNLDRRFLVLEL